MGQIPGSLAKTERIQLKFELLLCQESLQFELSQVNCRLEKKKINTLWKNITESTVFIMYYHHVQDTIQNYSKYEEPGKHKPHSREKTTESISQDDPDAGISTQAFGTQRCKEEYAHGTGKKKKKKRKHK